MVLRPFDRRFVGTSSSAPGYATATKPRPWERGDRTAAQDRGAVQRVVEVVEIAVDVDQHAAFAAGLQVAPERSLPVGLRQQEGAGLVPPFARDRRRVADAELELGIADPGEIEALLAAVGHPAGHEEHAGDRPLPGPAA